MDVLVFNEETKAPSLPYISLDQQILDMTQRKSVEVTLSFSAAVWENEEFLVIDIYSARNPVHPGGHVGWWKWPLQEKRDVTVRLVRGSNGYQVLFDGRAPDEFWANPTFTGLDTDVLEAHIVLRQTLSEAIDFDDKLYLYNTREALEAAEVRRAEIESPGGEPSSVPWFVWPAGTRVHLVSTNVFAQDAVGNFTFAVQRLLRANGIPCQLYAGNFYPALRPAIRHVSDLIAAVKEGDLLFVNFSIYDAFLPLMTSLSCKKVIYFHNITPPRFFQIYDAEHAAHCLQAVDQLTLLPNFDGIMANSISSSRVLQNLTAKKKKTSTAKENGHAVSENGRTKGAFEDASRLLEQAARLLEQQEEPDLDVKVCPPFMNAWRWLEITAEPVKLPPRKTLLLYVGRVAPHKRIEDLLALYRAYHKLDPDSALLIAGGASFEGYSGYLRYLMQNEYQKLKEHIFFLDSVSDGQLKTLYPAASAFVTMSEHEGFCVPLVEAMVFETPVFAFGCEAVVETMGQSGRVFYKKNFVSVAADLHDVVHTEWKRAKILNDQRRRLAEITSCIDGRTIWSTIEQVYFRRDDEEQSSGNKALQHLKVPQPSVH